MDSKSAEITSRGGSTPPPGTKISPVESVLRLTQNFARNLCPRMYKPPSDASESASLLGQTIEHIGHENETSLSGSPKDQYRIG
jgi:hypothetical protein